MKKIVFSALITVAAVSGSVFAYINQDENLRMNLLAADNIEALSNNEGYAYDSREEETIVIWDDEEGIHKSITIINCNGKGEIVCP